MLLIFCQACGTAEVHLLTTVSAVTDTRKWIDFLMFCWSALMFAKLLHQVKLFLRYDRLMGILKDEPFFLRITDSLFDLVGLLASTEVDGVSAILRLVENPRYSSTIPAFKVGIFVYRIPALRNSVCRWCRYSLSSEFFRNLSRTVSINTSL